MHLESLVPALQMAGLTIFIVYFFFLFYKKVFPLVYLIKITKIILFSFLSADFPWILFDLLGGAFCCCRVLGAGGPGEDGPGAAAHCKDGASAVVWLGVTGGLQSKAAAASGFLFIVDHDVKIQILFKVHDVVKKRNKPNRCQIYDFTHIYKKATTLPKH